MTGTDIPEDDRLGRPDRDTRPGPEERAIAARTRTLVLGPYPSQRVLAHRAEVAGRPGAKPMPQAGIDKPDSKAGVPNTRPPEARLDEAVGLAGAIDLDVVGRLVVTLNTPRPATLIGRGKVEEIAGWAKSERIDLIVMDCPLTPVQQRNLEKAWGAKVIDRTGLILEIFGQRARTREGTLQVELAHLAYQKSRLVRSWTHLERQRGGFGFLGGPGETQIEADRRVIQDRIRRIEHDLETVKRTRELHRESRRRVPYPTIALIGYTNAGKSTLFNHLTRAEVLAENMLFATLDPTSRAIRLPHGATAMLSDTVGFISDLPTMLVASFRATLEDVVEADVLLHVRDISHVDTEAEAQDVEEVLRQLGIDSQDRTRLIEVWNKADLVDPEERARLAHRIERMEPALRPSLVSAETGEGISALLHGIEMRVARGRPIFHITLPAGDGGGLHWLYEEAEVISRDALESGDLDLTIRVAPEKEPRLRNRFPGAEKVA